MEEEMIAQTRFDQLVSDDQSQILKACIPYLPPKSQQFFSVFTKARELSNAFSLFQRRPPDLQICSPVAVNPSDLLNDIRKFSYGKSREQLDQISNFLIMMQLMQVMNQSESKETVQNGTELEE